ncbi:MAG: phage minor head protein [Rhodospirillales bacterium]|nr:phage minor head protein [Rhodospirillales bacterium]
MADATAGIGLPFEEAIAYFRQKINVPTRRWTDLMNEAHAHGFAVAGAAQGAIVEDFRKAVAKAIGQGTGMAEFRRDFDAIVKKFGWSHTGTAGWRARVIYETNLSTAFAAGRYAQMTEPATKAAFPYWEYIHTPVQYPRLQHLAWDGMVLRADDPFWDAHYPPNGWGCRCVAGAVSEAGLARRGKSGPDASPGTATRPWKNPHTGETMEVPIGVDPGFAYSPGKAWKEGAALPVQAPDVKPEGPRQVLQLESLTAAIVRDFMREPRGALEIGRLGDALKGEIGAKSESVLFSAETMRKQSERHPEMEAEDYLAAAGLLAKPDAAVRQGERRIVVVRHGKRLLLGAVKSTRDREQNFLLALFWLEPRRLARLLARGTVIKEMAKGEIE